MGSAIELVADLFIVLHRRRRCGDMSARRSRVNVLYVTRIIILIRRTCNCENTHSTHGGVRGGSVIRSVRCMSMRVV